MWCANRSIQFYLQGDFTQIQMSQIIIQSLHFGFFFYRSVDLPRKKGLRKQMEYIYGMLVYLDVIQLYQRWEPDTSHELDR